MTARPPCYVVVPWLVIVLLMCCHSVLSVSGNDVSTNVTDSWNDSLADTHDSSHHNASSSLTEAAVLSIFAKYGAQNVSMLSVEGFHELLTSLGLGQHHTEDDTSSNDHDDDGHASHDEEHDHEAHDDGHASHDDERGHLVYDNHEDADNHTESHADDVHLHSSNNCSDAHCLSTVVKCCCVLAISAYTFYHYLSSTTRGNV